MPRFSRMTTPGNSNAVVIGMSKSLMRSRVPAVARGGAELNARV